MSHEHFDTLAAVYAVGALDGDELAQFEQHLAQGCVRCASALRESEEALAMSAREVPAVPPPFVKEALLRRAAAASALRSRPEPSRSPWLPWAAATAAAALIGAVSAGMFVARRYEARLAQMARESPVLHERLALYTAVINLLRDPSTRDVALRGTGPNPGAAGRMLWNKSGEGHLFVANLPPAPEGKAYEVWAFARGAPRSAGRIQTDASGKGGLHIAPDHSDHPAEVFTVTLEPAGDLFGPTGPVVLSSE